MAPPEKRTIHRPTHRPLVYLLLLALAVAIGVAAWWLLLRPPVSPPLPVESVVPAPAVPTPAPEPGSAMPEAAAPLPGASPAQPAAPAITGECQQLGNEIKAFFTRLDREDYIAPRNLNGGTQVYVGQLLDKLFVNPPVVVGETNSFFTILSNTAHFYRILKKDDVLLVKDILLNESENLEPLMALFYRWSLKAPECGNKTDLNLAMPLPGLYEYAGFFLNTLGGRSYLFRRESRLRLLVKYYSVLVLDQANGQRLNSHGIDIRPSLDSLSEEMRTAKKLKDQTAYLTTLTKLQRKYQAGSGMPKTAAAIR
jgi:hypothetical protein